MGPMDDRQERQAEDVARAQEEFPDWDIHKTWDGYIAVPKGTPLIRGMFLDAVTEKLRHPEE